MLYRLFGITSLIEMLNILDFNVYILFIIAAKENNRIKRRSYHFSQVQGHNL